MNVIFLLARSGKSLAIFKTRHLSRNTLFSHGRIKYKRNITELSLTEALSVFNFFSVALSKINDAGKAQPSPTHFARQSSCRHPVKDAYVI